MNNKLELQKEEQNLAEQYKNLETEEKSLQAVIQCQARKNEIQKLKEEITFRIYEIKGKLLEENEEAKNKIESELIKEKE
jgi:hypothetical protein